MAYRGRPRPSQRRLIVATVRPRIELLDVHMIMMRQTTDNLGQPLKGHSFIFGRGRSSGASFRQWATDDAA